MGDWERERTLQHRTSPAFYTTMATYQQAWNPLEYISSSLFTPYSLQITLRYTIVAKIQDETGSSRNTDSVRQSRTRQYTAHSKGTSVRRWSGSPGSLNNGSYYEFHFLVLRMVLESTA